uniref:Uncharacterized protein n=1 Tax=Mesocestoides corti TaxID=53468 RepID=A0A5K3FY09_MESCO
MLPEDMKKASGNACAACSTAAPDCEAAPSTTKSQSKNAAELNCPGSSIGSTSSEDEQKVTDSANAAAAGGGGACDSNNAPVMLGMVRKREF